MDKLVLGVMVCVVASACTASPPEAGDGKNETIRSAAELLVRAQDCAGELKRVERLDVLTAATALRIEPQQAVVLRGTDAELGRVRRMIDARLAEAQASASEALALALVSADGTGGSAAARARVRQGARAAEDLCRTSAALGVSRPDQRVATVQRAP